MGERFDPYYIWLSIRPDERPAHHYRLLGVAPFESNPDVIEGAADRQMTHVRTYQSGPNSAASQRLLNELATAKLTLLNPAKKEAYDNWLKSRLAAASGAVPPANSGTVPQAPTPRAVAPTQVVAGNSLDFVNTEERTQTTATNRRQSRSGPRKRSGGEQAAGWKRPGTYGAVILAVGVVGAALAVWLRASRLPIHGVEEGQSLRPRATASAKQTEAKKSAAFADDDNANAAGGKKRRARQSSSPPANATATASETSSPSVSSQAESSTSPPLVETRPSETVDRGATDPPPRTQPPTSSTPPASAPATVAVVDSPAVLPAAAAMRPGLEITNRPGESFGPLRILRDGSQGGYGTYILAISPDARWVFWHGGRSVRNEQNGFTIEHANALWDLKADAAARTLNHSTSNHNSVRSAAFTPDSKSLLLAFSKELVILDLPSGRVTRSPENKNMSNPALARDGSSLGALEGADGQAIFINPLSGATLARAKYPPIPNISMAPGGRYAYVIGAVNKDGQLSHYRHILDFQNPNELEVPLPFLSSEVRMGAVGFSSRGHVAFHSLDTHEISVWNISRRKLLFSIPLRGDDRKWGSLEFSSDAARLYVAGWTPLTAWEVESGKLLCEYPQPDSRWALQQLKLAEDDATFVSSSFANSVLLWKLATTQGPPPAPIPPNSSPPVVIDLEAAGVAVMPPATTARKRPVASEPPRTSPAAAAQVTRLNPPATRQNVPADADREAAEKLIQDVLGPELAKAKKPADKLDLAQKLVTQAAQSQTPAEKYVLLDKAQELFAAAGDPVQFFPALESLVNAFSVDGPALALAGGKRMQERLATKPHDDLAKGLMPYIELALREEHSDTAEKLAEAALNSARKAKDAAVVKQLVECKALVKDFKKRQPELEAAREALSKDADDAAANLILGKAYCLLYDDWTRGLPLLARAGSDPLPQLAAQELADPKSSGDQLKLADAWYAQGQSASGNEKSKFLAHAASWYRKALTDLSGMTRLKAQKRLDELEGSTSK